MSKAREMRAWGTSTLAWMSVRYLPKCGQQIDPIIPSDKWNFVMSHKLLYQLAKMVITQDSESIKQL